MSTFRQFRTTLGMLIAVALVFSFTQMPDRVNFSGSWKLDEAKSDLGQFAGFASRTLKVEQKENEISITRVIPGFNGGDPVTTTLVLSYDGKITESEGFGGSKRKSTSKWSADGQSLEINNQSLFERDGQSIELKSTETWTLKDGLLTVVNVSSSPRGESTTKAIYTK